MKWRATVNMPTWRRDEVRELPDDDRTDQLDTAGLISPVWDEDPEPEEEVVVETQAPPPPVTLDSKPAVSLDSTPAAASAPAKKRGGDRRRSSGSSDPDGVRFEG